MKTTTSYLPVACRQILVDAPSIPNEIDIIVRDQGTVLDKILAAISRLGICIHIMEPIMAQVTDGLGGAVFVERGELNILVIENKVLKSQPVTGDELVGRVALVLQGADLGGFLADNLRLNPSRPHQWAMDPESPAIVTHTLSFHCAYQLGFVDPAIS